MLSNIKTLIFLTITGVFVAGCADIPSDAPAFPDYKSEMRILNAANETALLMQATGDDPVITPYDTTVTVAFDTTLDTTIVTTADTNWTVPPLDTTIVPADTTIDTDVTPPDTTIVPADTTIVQPDSTLIGIDFTHDSTFTTTVDSSVTTKVFTIRQTFFKDLLVNTGDLAVSVDGASVGTLAYEDVTAYLAYPSGVYNITYTATTTRTADIVVTDSLTITNGEEGSGSGAVTVSTAVSPPTVDVAVSVSENVNLKADQQSLVILHDDDSGNRISLYHEKFMSETGTGSSLGLVKVINTYSAGGALDVSVVDGANIALGLEFLAQALDDTGDTTLVENFYSGYAEVPVGASVTVADGNTLSETAALTVTSGKRQSLIIFGTSTGFKLSQLSDK